MRRVIISALVASLGLLASTLAVVSSQQTASAIIYPPHGIPVTGQLYLYDTHVRVTDTRNYGPPIEHDSINVGPFFNTQAVLVNLTVIGVSSSGWAKAHGPDNRGFRTTSTVNWNRAGEAVSNEATVRLGCLESTGDRGDLPLQPLQVPTSTTTTTTLPVPSTSSTTTTSEPWRCINHGFEVRVTGAAHVLVDVIGRYCVEGQNCAQRVLG